MEMFIKVNGEMIKLMDMEIISIIMEQFMMGYGKMIYSMDKELRLGLMAADIKDSIAWGKSMALANINGLMVVLIQEYGMKIE